MLGLKAVAIYFSGSAALLTQQLTVSVFCNAIDGILPEQAAQHGAASLAQLCICIFNTQCQ
jgi:hypothetical protein